MRNLSYSLRFCPLPRRKISDVNSLSFCLDTKERKNQFLIEDVHLGSARCPLSESSGAERHFYQTSSAFLYRLRLDPLRRGGGGSSSSLLPIETKKKNENQLFFNSISNVNSFSCMISCVTK